MTKKQAHEMLNRARKGADVARHDIDRCLFILGDIDELPVVHIIKPAGTWERQHLSPLAPATHWDALA